MGITRYFDDGDIVIYKGESRMIVRIDIENSSLQPLFYDVIGLNVSLYWDRLFEATKEEVELLGNKDYLILNQ